MKSVLLDSFLNPLCPLYVLFVSFVRPFRFLRSRGRFGEASFSLILSVVPFLVVAGVFLAAAGAFFSSAFNELKKYVPGITF